MTCWKVWAMGLALALACGCAQPCFLHEVDYEEFRHLHLPAAETDPKLAVTPPPVTVPEPTSVNDPERPPRYLTLAEAIAIALQQGNVGSTSARLSIAVGTSFEAGGAAIDDLVGFTGGTVFSRDSIRVLALDPAIIAAGVESALSRFDTQWTTSMAWNTTDEPTQGLVSLSNGQAA